jgi:hypothetical protein
MGNRSGSSRSKSRENKYKYPDNYQNNLPTNKGVGHNNQRLYSSQQNGYSQQPYSNGYGQHNEGHLIGNTQAQYPITQTHNYQQNNTNPKSNQILYVANYDFTGTSTSGELSFVKGDRLEILDRFT